MKAKYIHEMFVDGHEAEAAAMRYDGLLRRFKLLLLSEAIHVAQNVVVT